MSRLVALDLALLVIVGVADYVTGYKLSFLFFYLLPVSLAAWFVGGPFAVAMSVASVVVWLGTDWVAGAPFPDRLVLGWNAAIALASFLVVAWLLRGLHAAVLGLERRVRERTADLRAEIAERTRLEAGLLAVSEREQRRIGHELHDGLCQHLTATALAGQGLGQKLAERGLDAECADAGRIVDFVEEAIGQTRTLARGLFPVRLEAEGIVAALRELTDGITRRHPGVECTLRCRPESLVIAPPVLAEHLFRIAQESVLNALRHGGARRVEIFLRSAAGLGLGGEGTLVIEDDGCGLPEPGPDRRAEGMGLRIMAHRAAIVGASFEASRLGPAGGTRIACRFPLVGAKEEEI